MRVPHETAAQRALALVPCLIALAVLAVQLQLALGGDLRFFFDHHVNDDVFYYLQWAWNVAHGHGATFDGINRTNGVQPLWAWMLSGLAAVGLGKEALVHAALATCAFLNAAGIYLLARTLQGVLGRTALVVTLAAWSYLLFATQILQSGMESSLNAAALILLLAALLRYARSLSGRTALFAGVAAGVATLSRIDNLFYAGTAGLVVLMASRPEVRWKHVVCFSFAVGLIAGPYFLYNTVSFGHPMPISGRVKQYSHFLDEVSSHGGYGALDYGVLAFRRLIETAWQVLLQVVPDSLWWTLRHGLGNVGATVAVIGTALGLVCLAWVLRIRDVAMQSERRVLGALGLTAIVHLGIIVFLVGKYTIYGRWYFIPQYLVVCIALGVLAQVLVRGMTQRSQRAGRAVEVLMVTGASLLLVRTALLAATLVHGLHVPYRTDNFLQTRYDVALWMKDTLPAGAICASFNAGQLGYFSDHSIVNLDGLVNNDALLAWHRARKPLVGYLDSLGVRYVIDWEMAAVTGRRTFHHIPLAQLRGLRTWSTPPEGPIERRFEAFEYTPEAAPVPFTPFLSNVEDYP